MKASARRGVKALTVSVVLVLGCICVLAACASVDDGDEMIYRPLRMDGVTYMPTSWTVLRSDLGDQVGRHYGHKVYEIQGEQRWFRVAEDYGTGDDNTLSVHQAIDREDATLGGEVVDLTGVSVITVHVGSSDGDAPVATITDPAQVDALVAEVVSAPLIAVFSGSTGCEFEFQAPDRHPIRLRLVFANEGGAMFVDRTPFIISVGTAFDGLCPRTTDGTTG